MGDERWQRICEAFDRLRGVSAAERGTALHHECGDDKAMRAELVALLRHHDSASGDFLRPLDAELPDRIASALQHRAVGSSPINNPGDRVGPYVLVEVIGEGGFGVVWLAEQPEPVCRQVAVKVIKPGMDSAQVIARFKAEQQALAMMNHPGVAKVFDAGTTERGLPYFVMEHVPGEPITHYCDGRMLSIGDRLALFVQVCEAVHHAHMKGIIHRDIKPSNVLVMASEGGEPRPVVIDFGVAKALSQRLTEATIYTQQGALVGTPEYMSPEQAAMADTDIDTRTDIYSLGVMLYELLTGALPFESQLLRKAGHDEIRRIIRDVEPPRPSTRLSALAWSEASATARQTHVGDLARMLRSELEWIPLCAMRKERSRRYRSAAELADDVRNYLGGRPLIAAPESRGYRARKFLRRNRGPVAAAVAIGFTLALATAVAMWFAVGEAEARQKAEDRARETQQVADYQAQMLAGIDPTDAGVKLMRDIQDRFNNALQKDGVPEDERSRQVQALSLLLSRVNATDTAVSLIDHTILAPAVAAIGMQFAQQPLVDAQLREAMSDMYRQLGLFDAAYPLQERALATFRRVHGDNHHDTLNSIRRMGGLLHAQGRLSDASPYYVEAVDGCRQVLGEEHLDTVNAIGDVGALLLFQGKLTEAEPYLREALEKAWRVYGPQHASTLHLTNNMGLLLRSQGRLAEAEPYFRDAIDGYRRANGDEHRYTLTAMSNMGQLLAAQGKPAEAESYYREVLEKQRRTLGEDHPATLTSINNMGFLLLSMGRLGEGEPYCRDAMDKSRRARGDAHAETLRAIGNYGQLLTAQGRLTEAEAYVNEAMEATSRSLGNDHPETLIAIGRLAALVEQQGKFAEAEPYRRQVVARSRSKLGDDHPDTIAAMNNLGVLLYKQGRLDEAAPYLEEAHEKFRTLLGGRHLSTLASIRNMGALREAQGNLNDAKLLFLEAMETRRQVQGEEHPHTLAAISNVAKVMLAQGELADAEPYLVEALEKCRRVYGDKHPSTLTSMAHVGALRTAQGRYIEAEELLLPAIRVADGGTPPVHGAHEVLVQKLLRLYTAWNEADPGKGYDAKAAEWKAKLDAIAPEALAASQGGGPVDSARSATAASDASESSSGTRK